MLRHWISLKKLKTWESIHRGLDTSTWMFKYGFLNFKLQHVFLMVTIQSPVTSFVLSFCITGVRSKDKMLLSCLLSSSLDQILVLFPTLSSGESLYIFVELIPSRLPFIFGPWVLNFLALLCTWSFLFVKGIKNISIV